MPLYDVLSELPSYIARYEQQIALSWLSLPKELLIGFIPEVIYRFTATRREKSMPYARSCAIDSGEQTFCAANGLPSDHLFDEGSTSNLRNSFDRVGENHLLWSSTRRTCSAKA